MKPVTMVMLGLASALLAPLPALAQTSTQSRIAANGDSVVTSTRHVRRGRTHITSTTTSRTHTYTHPHSRHARLVNGTTTTTHTTTRTTHVKKPTHALPASDGAPHSNPEADSMATRQVIEQTPPNDTTTLRDRTRTTTVGSAPPGTSGAGLVNINTASREELMALPGLDPELADRIIAARPYTLITDLQTRGLLTQAEYVRIERRIEVTP